MRSWGVDASSPGRFSRLLAILAAMIVVRFWFVALFAGSPTDCCGFWGTGIVFGLGHLVGVFPVRFWEQFFVIFRTGSDGRAVDRVIADFRRTSTWSTSRCPRTPDEAFCDNAILQTSDLSRWLQVSQGDEPDLGGPSMGLLNGHSSYRLEDSHH